MSFSADIKKRICEAEDGCSFCAAAETAGIIEFAGRLRNGEIYIVTENPDTAERLRSLLKTAFGFDTGYLFNANKRSYTFVISDNNMIDNITSALHLFSGTEKEKNEDTAPLKCCRKAYVRGAFLGGGSISDPQKSYHLEFGTRNKAAAEYLCRLLAEENIPVKVTIRKQYYIAYTKSSEVITDILGQMRAYTAVMDFYNISAEKEMRNNINRVVNCETANLDKTVKAAVKHINAINKIKKKTGLDFLGDDLQRTAELRLEYPEKSLSELGKLLGVGRSGVNHRLMKIMEIAEDL